ncbi:hypothetical protein M9458_029472, partial [Cirrhinus mrigala]
MEGFWVGIDDESRMVMSRGNSCWTYINFALWVEGSFYTMGEVEEDSATSVQPHLSSITTPEPDPGPPQTRETHLMPATEPEPAASSIVEEEPKVPADQVCEPAVISVPVRVLVELEKNDWLINWSAEYCLRCYHPSTFSKSVSAHNIPLLFIPPEPTIPSTPPPLAPLSPTVHSEAPPYNLDPPWELWHGMGIPWLCLVPLPFTNQLRPGSLHPRLHLGPPTGSTWVSRCHTITTDFQAVCCAPALHFYSSVRLLHPQASPGYSLTPVSPWSTGFQAPPRLLIAITTPWSL